jgi:hypothetical protein
MVVESSTKDYMGETNITFNHNQFKPRGSQGFNNNSNKRRAKDLRVHSACGSSRFFNAHRNKKNKAQKKILMTQKSITKSRYSRKNANIAETMKGTQTQFESNRSMSKPIKSFLQDWNIPVNTPNYKGHQYESEEPTIYNRSPVTLEPTTNISSMIDYNTNAFMYRIAKKQIKEAFSQDQSFRESM